MSLFKALIEGNVANIADAFAEAMQERLPSLSQTYKKELLESIYDSPEVLLEKARFRIVKARIRKGKVERRRKVSTIPGFTFRSRRGNRQLIRIPPRERLKRRISQRRGKVKRRAKRARSAIKYQRALRRRKGLGLH
jgi:hypothetical protein